VRVNTYVEELSSVNHYVRLSFKKKNVLNLVIKRWFSALLAQI